MNLPPWLVLLLLLSLTLALMYQVASRRYGWRVVAYWAVTFAAVMGFEALAESMGWNLTRVGDLRIGADVGGGALALAVMWFLGL